MLTFENACAQGFSRVVGMNRCAHLKENGALVVVLGYSVDAESGFRLACGNHGLMNVMAVHAVAAVGRQQRWMNVVAPLPKD